MRTTLGMMNSRHGTTSGIRTNSKEVTVYDLNRNMVRKFGSFTEASIKAEKYLGIKVSIQQVRTHCIKKSICQERYYFEMDPKYVFENE